EETHTNGGKKKITSNLLLLASWY
ncbi:unnamed protein product, partial [Rotaria sp. Silwood1]